MNKRGGTGLIIGIVVFIIIVLIVGGFFVWNINNQKKLVLIEEKLDSINIESMKWLKCSQDVCSIPDEFNVCHNIRCNSILDFSNIYSDVDLGSVELQTKFPKKYRLLARFSPGFVESYEDIQLALNQFNEIYDVDSITYDPKDIVTTDIEIIDLECSDDEIKINVKVVESNFEIKKIRFIFDGLIIEHNQEIPLVGIEKEYIFSKQDFINKKKDISLIKEVNIAPIIMKNGEEVYFSTLDSVSCNGV
ncbi:hypothetical protein CMI46_00305 [Candidatus Pacearchaeota archaeon]|nr:hypothetical protein [Candidatus Pacearchaeota archaeon]|tara:strand:+ start:92 stop:835 length:744 start_codon:yes stop_codon:yes gene_type:complete